MSESMSWEEAERLANEFLRQPVEQFYDEHYRHDNLALHRLVMNADEFVPMLRRRGYTLMVEDGYYFVVHGDMRTCIAEEFFKYQTFAEVARQLDYLIGQHHMCCVQCGEPLLFSAKYVDEEKQALKWYGVRSPKDGPQSAILDVCPGCGIEFGYHPVPLKEINDVEKANQPLDDSTE